MTLHYPLDRRTFLVAGGLSFFGLNLAGGAARAAGRSGPGGQRVARSAILLWLSGSLRFPHAVQLGLATEEWRLFRSSQPR